MRRPLAGSFWTLLADGPLDFTLISSFTLDAAVGGTYYLRYDEDGPPPQGGRCRVAAMAPATGLGRVGQHELGATRLVQPMAPSLPATRSRSDRSVVSGARSAKRWTRSVSDRVGE
uniref:Uncharacterized protein n=1 Tax=Ectopseudomonas oleovorans TaxID=301 RepID=A0A653AXD3_ECTOL